MHLGFHNINRPLDRVPHSPILAQIVHRDQHGAHRIHQPFAHFAPLGIQNGRVAHQVPHIAHQHQRAPLQRVGLTTRRRKAQVIIQAPRDRLAALLQRLFQIAFHQAQPVGIRVNLIGSIHRRHAVFAIHDGRHSRFQTHVCDTRRIDLPDAVRRVDDDLQMQPVPAQDHARQVLAGIGLIAHILRRLCQLRHARLGHNLQRAFDRIEPDNIRPGRPLQRSCFVQMRPRPSDHPRAAFRIIIRTARQIAQRVGAIESIIK